jgi:hypothetical protein
MDTGRRKFFDQLRPAGHARQSIRAPQTRNPRQAVHDYIAKAAAPSTPLMPAPGSWKATSPRSCSRYSPTPP